MEGNIKNIGRKDILDFPGLELERIRVKIDTGAHTSSIHCHHIEVYEKNGEEYVRFNLLDPEHDAYNEKLFDLKVYRKAKIKSSNAGVEERIIIQSSIKVYDETYLIQLSLTDRSEMEFPVLLGRSALSKRFLVDVSKSNLSYKSNKKRNK